MTVLAPVWDRQANSEQKFISFATTSFRVAVREVVVTEWRDKASTTAAHGNADLIAQGGKKSIVIWRCEVAVQNVDDVDLGVAHCVLETEATIFVGDEGWTDQCHNASGLGHRIR